jgi:type IV pilus assembly protein PilV
MNKNAGFTLIEVLIAMVVLAVGLLGLAGLQVTSLRNNQSAYNRSQATQLSYDLADRMRANIDGKATYTTILPGAATAKLACLSTPGCSPADMAENDLYEWNFLVTTNLPSGAATIAVLAGVYTITISWTENRDEDNDGVSDITSFRTSFQL